MSSPEKRVVIVTGAGIGIGQAAAKAFAALGDHVVVTDILEQEGEATVRDILTAAPTTQHRLTPFLKVVNGRPTYPGTNESGRLFNTQQSNTRDAKETEH